MTTPSNGTLVADGTTKINTMSAAGGPGRFTTIWLKGTFDSGTVKVQGSPSGDVADAMDLTDMILTANGYMQFQVRAASYYLVLSGAGSPSIEWWAV